MIKLNYKEKVNRFLPSFYELGKEYKLDGNTMQVYGYIWNVCMQLNDDGYCGYSDEHIATELGFEVRTFQNHLKKLKDKGLIIVENPGRRTKKNGESRMIRINPLNYIEVEEQMSIQDELIAQKDTEIQALKKQIDELLSAVNDEPPHWIMTKLYKKGFFTDEEINNAHRYNVLFEQLLRETNFGWCENMVDLWQVDSKTVKNKYMYIAEVCNRQVMLFRKSARIEKEETENELYERFKAQYRAELLAELKKEERSKAESEALLHELNEKSRTKSVSEIIAELRELEDEE